MLIMRFHKLIQSKVVWLIFIAIVIFTFVGLGVSSTGGGGSENQNAQQRTLKVATVDGKKVTLHDLLVSREKLTPPRGANLSEGELDELALQRLARLAYAKDAGIDVPIEAAQESYFEQYRKEDGTIDEDMRAAFIQQMSRQGYTELSMIQYLQEMMTLRLLDQVLASSILIPPYEAERWAQEQTNKLTVEYAVVPEALVTEKPTVSEKELTAYYEENKAEYRIQEQRRVKFITVTPSLVEGEIPPVTNEEALAQYEARPEAYVKTVEKEDPADPEKKLTENVPQTFEEAKAAIVQELSDARAIQAAEDKASDLAFAMIPTRRRPAKSIETVAEENALTVQSPDPFPFMQMVPGVLNPFLFSRVVFELDTTDLGKVSEPIVIGDNILVAVLEEIIEERIPELEEVREDVMAGAVEAAQEDALTVLAEETVGKLREQIEDGTAFMEAAKATGLEAKDPEIFQPKDFNSGMPSLPPALLADLSGKAVGEVYGPVQSRSGDVLIGYLASRVPQPADTAELITEIKNQLGFRLFLPALSQRFEEVRIDPLIQKDETFFAPADEASEEGSDA